MKGLATLLIAAATGAAAAGITAHLTPVRRASGPLVQEAYVWQRAWTEDVGDAVRARSGSFGGLVVLGAEISWSPGEVAWTDADWGALAEGGGPVGLAVRVGNHSGPWGAGHESTQRLQDTARELLRRARAGGLEPAELQIDFDCATSRLDGYREWVQAVREVVAPVPVTITALPAWLDGWAFGRLARETDGFVLQVHSLSPPPSRPEHVPEHIPPLCDPERARRWVETAARVQVPFRVALPTYGYLLAFSPDGELLGISAEGEPRAWPDGTIVRDVRADAAALAGLVRAWRADRPELLRGAIWYRLPVGGDALNWTYGTLERVMAGADPRPGLRVELRRPAAGLVEVELVNAGEADARARIDVELRWDGARLLAADALHGFELRRDGERVRLRAVEEIGTERIPPRGRRSVGWLRFEEATDVEAELVR